MWNETEIKHWNNSDLFQSCFKLIIIFIRMLRNVQIKNCFSQSESTVMSEFPDHASTH